MSQFPNKIKIPIKTKIAAKIIMIYCGVALFFILSLFVVYPEEITFERLSKCFLSIVYFAFAYLMLKSVYLAWSATLVFLVLIVFSSFINFLTIERPGQFVGSFLALFFNIIPLFLLIVDRKNYFAAVEKVEGKAKEG